MEEASGIQEQADRQGQRGAQLGAVVPRRIQLSVPAHLTGCIDGSSMRAESRVARRQTMNGSLNSVLCFWDERIIAKAGCYRAADGGLVRTLCDALLARVDQARSRFRRRNRGDH